MEPDAIRTISYDGADSSVTMDELTKGQTHPRRYRNRRIGEFLKELDLTEGMATGIPTIQGKLKFNGSPQAEFKTDDDRTFFMVTIPVHPSFNGVGIIAYDTQNDTQKLTDRQRKIVEMVLADGHITTEVMADAIGVSVITIKRDLSEIGIRWQGHPKTGHWEIVTG